MKRGTVVEVYWIDIEGTHGWTSVRKAKRFKPPEFRTVGYFLNRDDVAVRITGTHSARSTDVNDVSVFPVGCVTRIKCLG